jgi:tRNA dimethylallyltransferase
MAVLAGTLGVEAAIQAAQQGHRNYAKRQLTWFRREPQVAWIEDFGDQPEVLRTTVHLVQAGLSPAFTGQDR